MPSNETKSDTSDNFGSLFNIIQSASVRSVKNVPIPFTLLCNIVSVALASQ
jgi:hypothetical protein